MFALPYSDGSINQDTNGTEKNDMTALIQVPTEKERYFPKNLRFIDKGSTSAPPEFLRFCKLRVLKVSKHCYLSKQSTMQVHHFS